MNIEVSPDRLIVCARHPANDENAGMDLCDTLHAQQVSYAELDTAPGFAHFPHQDASVLSECEVGVEMPSEQTIFSNFLTSHDGIGMNTAREILSPLEIYALVKQTLVHGRLISYKNNGDGSQSPYEMKINYFDALSNLAGDGPLQLQIDRFMDAQAIMRSLGCLPGICFHSLFDSRGWKEGLEQTGHSRTFNSQ